VWLTYERSDGEVVERLVEPLGLVAKGRIWYLVAVAEEALRTYRVSRVQAARLTEQPFTRPKGFDLAAYWEASKARFVAGLPRYSVIVQVDPAILDHLQQTNYFVRVEQVGLPDAAGWVKVNLRFELEEEAAGYILGFGSQMEVLEPAALREKVIRLAEEALALYRQVAVLVHRSATKMTGGIR
jgi:predicted DNA-binding transcriptional regulator YafY